MQNQALNNKKYLVGVDTGGTFTDFVIVEPDTATINVLKVLSTPDNPAEAILSGLHEAGLASALADGEVIVVHGSTVATNAALERKGVKTVYVTNKGFKDTLTIGRQTREELYNLKPLSVTPPVPEELCLEVDVRLDANGEHINTLSPEDIDQLRHQLDALAPESVAINLLFSYLNDEDEIRLAKDLSEKYFVSHSSDVLPEPNEYERGIATWLNAYLGPKVQGYLNHLKQGVGDSPLAIMQSNGGTMDAEQAGNRAVDLLLSGPAGGIAAAHKLSQSVADSKLLTFDMGGTSTDVALLNGDITLTSEGRIGPYPVAVPMVDIYTIGAGGGSVAFVDNGGMLQVGPESAGAKPGPACYNQGGTRATVTDANAVLGRLLTDQCLAGGLPLQLDKAQQAISDIADALGCELIEAAAGIITLVNEHMAAALRVMSVQRGLDPKEFSLCCFGGAGGLHVCALAENLGMNQAVVPAHAGVYSALGMLVAPKLRQSSQSYVCLLESLSEQKLAKIVHKLCGKVSAQLTSEGVDNKNIEHQVSLDLRYKGQSFCLQIPYQNPNQLEQAFHQLHRQKYGHELPLPVELVTVRVQAKAQAIAEKYLEFSQLPNQANTTQTPQRQLNLAMIGTTDHYQREYLAAGITYQGPALITEPTSTILVEKGWQFFVDNSGNILLEKQ